VCIAAAHSPKSPSADSDDDLDVSDITFGGGDELPEKYKQQACGNWEPQAPSPSPPPPVRYIDCAMSGLYRDASVPLTHAYSLHNNDPQLEIEETETVPMEGELIGVQEQQDEVVNNSAVKNSNNNNDNKGMHIVLAIFM
jgi:hypothetical protein